DGLPAASLLEREANLSQARPHLAGQEKLITAVDYADIPHVAMGPTRAWQQTPKKISQPQYDLFAEVIPSAAEKEQSLARRTTRRAFNGAPPVIPHAVEATNDAACYACHAQGMKLGELQASVMSHRFLANCTQCHAAPTPAALQAFASPIETKFVGLSTPHAGQRAYPGAPPTIPHSQWMRENCVACHGGPHGWAGLESTHPWRSNCTQCHAPSAQLDQAISVSSIPQLPPLQIQP
ncbi:MAG: hypothetical protein KDA45_12700, partial [Planctomycetales bacterium]|nr:hypothetical protein [Planctomycetales bacterium]